VTVEEWRAWRDDFLAMPFDEQTAQINAALDADLAFYLFVRRRQRAGSTVNLFRLEPMERQEWLDIYVEFRDPSCSAALREWLDEEPDEESWT
jgi:hypothetical protein